MHANRLVACANALGRGFLCDAGDQHLSAKASVEGLLVNHGMLLKKKPSSANTRGVTCRDDEQFAYMFITYGAAQFDLNTLINGRNTQRRRIQ